MRFRALVLPTAVLALQGCIASTTLDDQEPRPVATVKPEIDFSDTTPDCKTAAERIERHVEVGLPMRDVERLVGKPAYKLPGLWWWSDGFSRTGRPYVTYDVIGSSAANATVTEVSIEVSKC